MLNKIKSGQNNWSLHALGEQYCLILNLNATINSYIRNEILNETHFNIV